LIAVKQLKANKSADEAKLVPGLLHFVSSNFFDRVLDIFFGLYFSRTKSPNMFYKIVVPGRLQETPADLNMGVRHVSVRSATILCRIAHPCDVYVAWQSSGPFIPGLLCSERLPNYSKESLTKTRGSNAGGPGGKIVSCK